MPHVPPNARGVCGAWPLHRVDHASGVQPPHRHTQPLRCIAVVANSRSTRPHLDATPRHPFGHGTPFAVQPAWCLPSSFRPPAPSRQVIPYGICKVVPPAGWKPAPWSNQPPKGVTDVSPVELGGGEAEALSAAPGVPSSAPHEEEPLFWRPPPRPQRRACSRDLTTRVRHGVLGVPRSTCTARPGRVVRERPDARCRACAPPMCRFSQSAASCARVRAAV